MSVPITLSDLERRDDRVRFFTRIYSDLEGHLARRVAAFLKSASDFFHNLQLLVLGYMP